MQLSPFYHKAQCPWRECAFEDSEIINPYDGAVVPVTRMEMGRVMVSIKHGNYDSEKTAYLWHLSFKKKRAQSGPLSSKSYFPFERCWSASSSFSVNGRHSPGLSIPRRIPANSTLLSFCTGWPMAMHILLTRWFLPSKTVSSIHEFSSVARRNFAVAGSVLPSSR